MTFAGILFDINGTLVDILTDEGRDDIYRTISNYLLFQGISIDAEVLRNEYFARLQNQKKQSGEQFPEFNAVQLWRDMIEDRFARAVIEKPMMADIDTIPHLLAVMFRAASMFKLQPYPGVAEVLQTLGEEYRLAALSDAQSAWAEPELRAVGLISFFETVVVSGDLGYRKPDPRMFSHALDGMQLSPKDVLFVGNDMYRDIHGAQQAGMRTVYFATNQGRNKHKDTEPDYIIYNFQELPTAIRFLEEKSVSD